MAILLSTYWFLKRKLPNTIVGGRFAKVISRVYVDRNTSLVLVRILKEYYVIMITQNYATVIKKLDTIDEEDLEMESEKSFESIFQRLVGGKK
jgi:flagellar protein FliO/FliZ